MVVVAGLLLNEIYLLIKKIGKGEYSTVWLTYNIKTYKIYATKIQFPEDYKQSLKEIELMDTIKNYNCKYLNTHIDSFEYKTKKGISTCMVFKLYACSLHELILENGLPERTVVKIIDQIIGGLNVLHDDAKIIHSDLKPENILIEGVNKSLEPLINKINNIDFKKIHKKHKNIRKSCNIFLKKLNIEYNNNPPPEYSYYSLESSDSELKDKIKKRHQSVNDSDDDDLDDDDVDKDNSNDLYNTDDLDYDDEESDEESKSRSEEVFIDDKYMENPVIAITDFGNSFYIDDKTTDEIQTRYYRAPEIIMDCPYDEKSDLWSVGCIMFELLTGELLFDPSEDDYNMDIHHLICIEELCGKIPKKMIKTSKRKKYLFDKNYNIKNSEKISEKKRLFDAELGDLMTTIIARYLQVLPDSR
jgi:serine/threonine protein kinase